VALTKGRRSEDQVPDAPNRAQVVIAVSARALWPGGDPPKGHVRAMLTGPRSHDTRSLS
jgi:hypothetical protein